MKTPASYPGSNESAFTLIELLVVIAIIAILASMVVPIAGAIDKKKKIAVAQTELSQIETAIESYKARYNSFPPDNPKDQKVNPLYFELVGSTKINNGTAYRTLDAGVQLNLPADFDVIFGAPSPVQGLVNSSAGAQTDDARGAENFVKNLRPGQIGQVTNATGTAINGLLLCSVRWSGPQPIVRVAVDATANPWQYNATNPTNNPASFDLWVDL